MNSEWTQNALRMNSEWTQVNAFLFEAVKLALQQTELRFRTDVAQLHEDLASACPRVTEPILLGRLNREHQTDQTEGKD